MLFLKYVCGSAKQRLLSLPSPLSRRHLQKNVLASTTNTMANWPLYPPSQDLSSKSGSSSTTPSSGEDFERRNKLLNRPVSPHMTIYKWGNNMILSMMHRFTGIALYGIPFGFAAAAILLPESYPYYLGIIEEMHFKPFVLTAAKFLIALPFSFHLLNGVQHLIRDVGYLWTVKEINISCYVVVLLAIGLALHLTSL